MYFHIKSPIFKHSKIPGEIRFEKENSIYYTALWFGN